MIDVLEGGALTSVQTAEGRPDWRHLGVPVGGAADAWSARLANRLVGNPDDAPLLEITLTGPTLRFDAAAIVAMAGTTFDARLDGLPVRPFTALQVSRGATLAIGSGHGARGYLAMAGGIDVPPALGSAATDLRSGFGGLHGRAVRAGDRLALGASRHGRPMRWTGTQPDGPIRIVAGPHHEMLEPRTLTAHEWAVAQASDRTGVRLDGPALAISPAEVPSMGLPLGAVQVPPDGRPIVMLADRPVTGGYPAPACVIRADVGRVARLRAGDPLRFAAVSVDDARAALREAEDELAALEPLVGPGDDELGWAGALR